MVRSPQPARTAFTLMEMLLVVAIIGLLAALLVPQLGKQFGKSQVKITTAQLANLAQSVEQFRLDIQRYPTEQEGLKVLVDKPLQLDTWDGPYLGKKTLPTDGWGREFIYKLDDTFGFRIMSLGADGVEGGEGANADLDNRS